MADANARLEFLWKASHMLLAQSPGASSHYMSQFLTLALDRDLRLHEDIQTRSCAGCGSIFVPGVNAQVRVVPVTETKIEREKRKRLERKRAKMERNSAQKDKDGDASMAEPTTTTTTTATTPNEQKQAQDTIPPPSTSESGLATKGTSVEKNKAIKEKKRAHQPDPKNIIRITPYTEMVRQENQQQQQIKRRMQGQPQPTGSAKKSEKRTNQVLNHVYYSCKRCHRETELDGTKEGYLNSRIKVSETDATQRAQERKIRKLNRLSLKDKDTTVSPTVSVTMASAIASPAGLNTLRSPSMASLNNSVASSPQARNVSRMVTPQQSPHIGSTSSPMGKRPASPIPQQSAQVSNLKKTKYSASMPVSPVGGLSLASSVASSAATSPSSSPRIPSLGGAGDKMGGSIGGGNNKKKKKQNLASLLASQKAKESDNNNGGAGASSGGDSALASFLMGL
ncbi:hypothetical protein BGZ83_011731 [Gryganskiella cystojenkinii]|nr:hypothetical protein BGZ83_011731 [Gryganskiella cystojenkinii]